MPLYEVSGFPALDMTIRAETPEAAKQAWSAILRNVVTMTIKGEAEASPATVERAFFTDPADQMPDGTVPTELHVQLAYDPDGHPPDIDRTYADRTAIESLKPAAPDLFGVMIGMKGNAIGALIPHVYSTYDEAQTEATSRANAPGRWACVWQIMAAGEPVQHDGEE